MNDDDRTFDPVVGHLRAAVRPWRDLEPQADLWPRMRRRLEEPPARFGWLESLIVGLVALALAIFPELIPLVLYHL